MNKAQKSETPVSSKLNRRQFLTIAGTAALAFPNLIPSSALGLGNSVAPSNRITLGVVGWGFQGPGVTKSFLALKDCQVVAACDLDSARRKTAVSVINKHYKNWDCKGYSRHEPMFERKDIDAVMLAVPDHWHAILSVDAANHKKHIYGEKPLARTIYEQQQIVKAVERNGIIWQTGSWQRSEKSFHKAAEIVRNGYIGKVTHVEVGLPDGHTDFGKSTQYRKITPPPPELDYERWIGPSKMEPYIRARVHANWRWNYNTGGGQLLDWIGHHGDIAHWGLDFDRSGPSEIEGHGDFPAADAVWNTCTKFKIQLKYPQDITMTVSGGHSEIKRGTKWIGTDGWVYVDRSAFDSSNQEYRDYKDLPEELRKVKLYVSNNHQQNFIDCIKSGKETITPVQTAHHSAIPGHLGLISMLTGRKLKWDVASEQIIGDDEAAKLLTRPYRAPYEIPTGLTTPSLPEYVPHPRLHSPKDV